MWRQINNVLRISEVTVDTDPVPQYVYQSRRTNVRCKGGVFRINAISYRCPIPIKTTCD